jgi:hypothetical protein
VRLLVQDCEQQAAAQQQQLAALARSLQPALAQDPTQVDALGFSCVAAPGSDAAAISGALPQVCGMWMQESGMHISRLQQALPCPQRMHACAYALVSLHERASSACAGAVCCGAHAGRDCRQPRVRG